MTIVLQAVRLLLAGGLLVVAAGFLSACLGHRSIVAFVLSTYLLAWTMVVAFTLLLSPLDLVTAGATWAWLAAACATAGLVWHGMGRPPPPLRGRAAPLPSRWRIRWSPCSRP
jgi:hypothetical protein